MKKLMLVLLVVVVAVGAYYLWSEGQLSFLGGSHIEAVILKYDDHVNDVPVQSRYWIAKDRLRNETEAADGTETVIVRLDKGEVWLLDDKKKTCDVLNIEDTERSVRVMAKFELKSRRDKRAWANGYAALEAYMEGNYDVQASPNKVERNGYECTEVTVQLGSILRLRSLRAADDRIPESFRDADDAVKTAIQGSAAPAAVHLADKQSKVGNLAVYSEIWLDLGDFGPSTHSVQQLKSISVEEVEKSLFEVPEGYKVIRAGEDRE